MAEIYLARVGGIEGFQKHVVVKRILPRFAADETFVTMFLDEARLAAQLHHQNIAQVYDIGRQDDVYFFSMEYLHGADLRRILKWHRKARQRLPLRHALTISTGVAAGLHYAHEKLDPSGRPLEIVHRDVSPSNIVVTYDGGVKIVDFGIARATVGNIDTHSGSLKGKVGYMSPEQCKGLPLDRRSDIFSLGILLFEATTTTRLFRARNDVDYTVMSRIVHGDIPSPSSRFAGYPAALEAIVMRALRRDPGERYATAKQLLDDLEAYASTARIPLSPSALSSYLEMMFGRPPEPWHQAPPEDELTEIETTVFGEDEVSEASNEPTVRSSPRQVAESIDIDWDEPEWQEELEREALKDLAEELSEELGPSAEQPVAFDELEHSAPGEPPAVFDELSRSAPADPPAAFDELEHSAPGAPPAAFDELERSAPADPPAVFDELDRLAPADLFAALGEERSLTPEALDPLQFDAGRAPVDLDDLGAQESEEILSPDLLQPQNSPESGWKRHRLLAATGLLVLVSGGTVMGVALWGTGKPPSPPEAPDSADTGDDSKALAPTLSPAAERGVEVVVPFDAAHTRGTIPPEELETLPPDAWEAPDALPPDLDTPQDASPDVQVPAEEVPAVEPKPDPTPQKSRRRKSGRRKSQRQKSGRPQESPANDEPKGNEPVESATDLIDRVW